MVAGFSIWGGRGHAEEAVALGEALPQPAMPGRSVAEIRPFFEVADLADFLTPEELATPREGRAREAAA